MTRYTVRAKRWADGWELHIGDDVGVTQAHILADAERMVRDYLRLDGHADWESADIDVVPQLGGSEQRAKEARRKTAAATKAQAEAAAELRAVAKDLRSKGLSVADTATVLGVSRGRVSQLVKDTGRGPHS